MQNNCVKCGSPLGEGQKFCTNCGAKVLDSQVPASNEINNQNYENQNSQMPPAQGYHNTQIPSKSSKKPDKKLIAVILAVVVAVVVIAAVVFGIFGGEMLNSEESKFVGTWEYSVMGMSVQYKFNSDNTMDVGSMGQLSEVGTWKVENNKLVISSTTQVTSTVTEGSYDYSFSNGGNKLTLTMNGYDITFTKK